MLAQIRPKEIWNRDNEVPTENQSTMKRSGSRLIRVLRPFAQRKSSREAQQSKGGSGSEIPTRGRESFRRLNQRSIYRSGFSGPTVEMRRVFRPFQSRFDQGVPYPCLQSETRLPQGSAPLRKVLGPNS